MMKNESLQALVIDHHFGELPDDVAELLEAHLAADAGAREEAGRILATLAATREALHRYPELARTPDPQPLPVSAFQEWRSFARVAAVFLFAALSALGGFLIGRGGEKPLVKTPPVSESHWTRYQLASNTGEPGLQVVRLDDFHHPILK